MSPLRGEVPLLDDNTSDHIVREEIDVSLLPIYVGDVAEQASTAGSEICENQEQNSQESVVDSQATNATSPATRKSFIYAYNCFREKKDLFLFKLHGILSGSL